MAAVESSRSKQFKGGERKVEKRFSVKFVVGLACIALMVSVLSFIAMTAGASHEHEFGDPIFHPTGPTVSISDSQHRTPGIDEFRCECGALLLVPSSQTDYHSIVWYDLGHVPGTQTHNREGICGACGYYTTQTYYCPGNPCIYPHD